MIPRPTPNLLTANLDNGTFGKFQDWVWRIVSGLDNRLAKVEALGASSSVAGNINVRAKTQTVVAGSNTIVLAAPMTTNTYSVSAYVSVSSSEGFTPTINSKSAGSFVIDCASAGTLSYTAVEAI